MVKEKSMKLLITTQAIDKNDPILGFFHGWVRELAKRAERIDVICLKKGMYDLPPHVHVHSLGKEHDAGYIRYITRLFRYVWKYRGEYDAVFSHMNPHYIVLCGWLWTLLRKRMFFWRNHAQMNVMTRIAAWFATNVFYTSPFACTARYPHAIQMPVGIDTSLFAPNGFKEETRPPYKVLCLGRLSPVKKVEMFVGASAFVSHTYEFHVYGDAPSQDRAYAERIKCSAPNTLFHPAVINTETPSIYRSHDVYVNLTPNGSMDKTVLEAAACCVPVLVANESFRGTLPEFSFLLEATPECLAERIRDLVERPPENLKLELVKTRERIIERHSLHVLADKLIHYMQ